ncbi:MAG: hypothetical protein EOO38_32165 [Cytophagaceae bacterium]|nr:MAG: hypothetical protein EOO38_32165 [Cytophagaceae bacterium]
MDWFGQVSGSPHGAQGIRSQGWAIARVRQGDERHALAGILRDHHHRGGMSQATLAAPWEVHSLLLLILRTAKEVDLFAFIRLADALEVLPLCLFEELLAIIADVAERGSLTYHDVVTRR